MKKQTYPLHRVLDLIKEIGFAFLITVIGSFSVVVLLNREKIFRQRIDFDGWSYYFVCACIAVILLICLFSLWSEPANLKCVWRRLQLRNDSAIPANHGQTIVEVIKNIQHEEYEYVAIFAPDGRKLHEWTSLSPNKVSVEAYKLENVYKIEGCTAVHNHPMTQNAFTPSDVVVAIDFKLSRSIVVATDILHEINLTSDTWKFNPNDVSDYGNRLYKAIVKPTFRKKRDFHNVIKFNKGMAKKYGFSFHYETLEDYLRKHS